MPAFQRAGIWKARGDPIQYGKLRTKNLKVSEALQAAHMIVTLKKDSEEILPIRWQNILMTKQEG